MLAKIDASNRSPLRRLTPHPAPRSGQRRASSLLVDAALDSPSHDLHGLTAPGHRSRRGLAAIGFRHSYCTLACRRRKPQTSILLSICFLVCAAGRRRKHTMYRYVRGPEARPRGGKTPQEPSHVSSLLCTIPSGPTKRGHTTHCLCESTRTQRQAPRRHAAREPGSQATLRYCAAGQQPRNDAESYYCAPYTGSRRHLSEPPLDERKPSPRAYVRHQHHALVLRACACTTGASHRPLARLAEQGFRG